MFIYLDFVEGFSCRMCGACCRNDWIVTLDEASYNRNHRLFDELGKNGEFIQAFRVLAKQASPGEYAYIAKQTSGACWFLEENHLCRLHKTAGHLHLDSVCRTFPRYPMSTARGLELTLSFSCPTVLEMACREQPLTIVKSEKPPLMVEEDSAVLAVFPKQQPAGSALRYYFELEQHMIDIVQCRSLPWQQRLNMLQETILLISRPGDAEPSGRHLNNVIRENYDAMDKALSAGFDRVPMTDILVENMLVNIIFKKIFYLYGLNQGLRLLVHVWRELDAIRRDPLAHDRLKLMKSAARDIEFRFGHDRKSWLQDIV